METNDLERRFERAFADEPPLRSVPEHVGRGHRALFRQRAIVAGAGVFAAAVAVSGLTVTTGFGQDRADLDPATNDADTIATCKEVSESKEHADLLFASGTPTLVAKATTSRETSAVLLSADEKYWGECHIDSTGQREDGNGITAYEMKPPATGVRSGRGVSPGEWNCDDKGDCRITFSVLERRPSEVARAEYVLANGEVLEVEAVHGLLFLEYEGPAPRGPETAVVDRARFYAADGTVLAEDVRPGIEPTPGVKRLLSYPDLTGSPVGLDALARNRALEEHLDSPDEETASEKEIAEPQPGLTGRARLQDACTLDGLPEEDALTKDPNRRVVAWHETPTTAVAVLEASDGKTWGGCFLPTTKVPYAHPSVGMLVRGDQPYVMSAGPTHADRPQGTRDYYWLLADKLDPRVARVEVTMVDGQEIAAETVDGYVALGTSGLLPADAAWDEDGWTHLNLHRSLRFYDADGKLLGETRNALPIPGFPSQS